MDDRQDPAALFFDGEEDVDLYAALSLTSDATPDNIKKAYRKLALVYHPDKHASSNDDAKAAASHKFQQIGFAYSVLSDEKRRQRYDKTGKTDEGLEDGPGEDGWEAYFEDLFDQVTKAKLDELKLEYQGSAEELADLEAAYTTTGGSIDEIMRYIPHSTNDDEGRFVVAISSLITQGKLKALPAWETSTKDEKARLVRKKQATKEAVEAEELARELGVWDEFYGGGKAGPRRGKGKAAKKGSQDGNDEEDVSALQALILKKQKNRDSFLDGLAAKYAQPEPRKKGKGKRKADEDVDVDVDDVEVSPKKKRRGAAIPDPPELDDAEFEKIQKRLFGDKPKFSADDAGTKGKKAGKARKGKS
ncbi:DnaJ-domain-containing protein [Amylostereum chailletii]|nr:DnaJ-domain-containing protein [Amylostereum chailletii]